MGRGVVRFIGLDSIQYPQENFISRGNGWFPLDMAHTVSMSYYSLNLISSIYLRFPVLFYIMSFLQVISELRKLGQNTRKRAQ